MLKKTEGQTGKRFSRWKFLGEQSVLLGYKSHVPTCLPYNTETYRIRLILDHLHHCSCKQNTEGQTDKHTNFPTVKGSWTST